MQVQMSRTTAAEHCSCPAPPAAVLRRPQADGRVRASPLAFPRRGPRIHGPHLVLPQTKRGTVYLLAIVLTAFLSLLESQLLLRATAFAAKPHRTIAKPQTSQQWHVAEQITCIPVRKMKTFVAAAAAAVAMARNNLARTPPMGWCVLFCACVHVAVSPRSGDLILTFHFLQDVLGDLPLQPEYSH